MRVSQPWAGKGWGAIAIPRIGQEIIVDFLEGDPDRLIITGRVCNDVNKPPTSYRSTPSPDSRAARPKKVGGYNEYVMDDTKGKELIWEHAQLDKDSTIEHDLREQVLKTAGGRSLIPTRSPSVVIVASKSTETNRLPSRATERRRSVVSPL